jgi:hypothetical protein
MARAGWKSSTSLECLLCPSSLAMECVTGLIRIDAQAAAADQLRRTDD